MANISRKSLEFLQKTKREEENTVNILKEGCFYYAIESDAHIISYLLEYKLMIGTNEIEQVGFGERSIKKVEDTLKQQRINYKITIRENDKYIKENSIDYGLNNFYDMFLQKAIIYLDLKDKRNEVDKKLSLLENEPNYNNILNEILEIIEKEERGKNA